MTGFAGPFGRLRTSLPEGLGLPEAAWRARHHVVLGVIAAHVVALPILGLMQGWGPAWSLGEGALLGVLTWIAALPFLSRRLRSGAAALAAVTSSAVLTQFSGGYIEAHFHYFVMVALVALYQDWVPFLLAILYVAFDHGVIGTLAPGWVYNHTDAAIHPWRWAGIHAAAILAECAAIIVLWSEAERSRARADLVLESAGEGVLGLGLDGRVTYANPAVARLLGTSVERLIGHDVRQRFVAPGGMDPWSLGTAMPIPVEGSVKTRTGELRAAEWTVAPTRRASRIVGHHVIVRDISARRQAEEDRRTLDRLQEQDRVKTQLLHAASHELNTPVAILRYQMRHLRPRLPGEDAVLQKGFSMLEDNVERLGNLVRDTLEVARIEGGRLRFEPRSMDVAAVVRDACAQLSILAEQQAIRLVVEAPAPVTAHVDPARITQVILNLVANALNHTPGGGAVTVAVSERAGHVRVEVRDTGPGIPAASLPLLFRPFSQLPDARSRTAAGTGLGLFISKGIVEAHGGRIWCEDRPGPGALFVFEVPLLPVAVLLERSPDRAEQVVRANGLGHEGADARLAGALADGGVPDGRQEDAPGRGHSREA